MPGAVKFCNVTGFTSCGLNITVRDALGNLWKIFQIKFLVNTTEGLRLTSGEKLFSVIFPFVYSRHVSDLAKPLVDLSRGTEEEIFLKWTEDELTGFRLISYYQNSTSTLHIQIFPITVILERNEYGFTWKS